MEKTMSKILLVDDETMLLDSLEIILSLNDHEIVGKAHDGVEALEQLNSVQPDLALVDLNMKGMGGIELIGEMKKLYPAVKILVLTTFYDDQNITAAISRGADGYLLKDSGKNAILGAVRQILGGTTVLDAKVMQRLTALMAARTAAVGSAGGLSGAGTSGSGTGGSGDSVADRGPDGTSRADMRGEISALENAADPLTEREKEICTLIAEGLTNRQIADRLYISEGTVKNYISSIYDKTGIHDRVKLTLALKG
ncbi:MAG: response regulator transcription factor [Eubacterium sp.]|nr:response regulator transcription factor [Eubacterium sp.]